VTTLLNVDDFDTPSSHRLSSTIVDDPALIGLAIQRDADAIDTLVRRYTPLLMGFLRARVPRSYEDVYQETFALALAKLDTLRDRSRFGPWLLTIAQRAVVDWARADLRHGATRDRERVAAEVQGWSGGGHRGADRDHASAEEAQAIIDRILELPDPYNLVVYLSLIHEKEPQTIAQELGLRPGTVRMRLKRGLDRLRKSLK